MWQMGEHNEAMAAIAAIAANTMVEDRTIVCENKILNTNRNEIMLKAGSGKNRNLSNHVGSLQNDSNCFLLNSQHAESHKGDSHLISTSDSEGLSDEVNTRTFSDEVHHSNILQRSFRLFYFYFQPFRNVLCIGTTDDGCAEAALFWRADVELVFTAKLEFHERRKGSCSNRMQNAL